MLTADIDLSAYAWAPIGTAAAPFSGAFVDHNLNDLSWWTQKHVGYAIREAANLLEAAFHAYRCAAELAPGFAPAHAGRPLQALCRQLPHVLGYGGMLPAKCAALNNNAARLKII